VNATLHHFACLELPAEVITAYVGDGLSMLVRRALGDPEGKFLLRYTNSSLAQKTGQTN